jgi:hypothetical protein
MKTNNEQFQTSMTICGDQQNMKNGIEQLPDVIAALRRALVILMEPINLTNVAQRRELDRFSLLVASMHVGAGQ